MSKSYTPGLKVLNQTKIYKDRILPMKGEVHTDIGEEVFMVQDDPNTLGVTEGFTTKNQYWVDEGLNDEGRVCISLNKYEQVDPEKSNAMIGLAYPWAIRPKFLERPDENTYDVDSDYIGSGTNHLGCELELENDRHTQSKDWIKDGFDTYSPYKKDNDNTESIQKQIYNEMTADGLPAGGDSEAVMESHKLAEEIVNAQKGSWIYESPDGGKTVFRRPAGDYDPKNKEEIDWETKEPTGRVFSDYNNGNWKGDER